MVARSSIWEGVERGGVELGGVEEERMIETSSLREDVVVETLVGIAPIAIASCHFDI